MNIWEEETMNLNKLRLMTVCREYNKLVAVKGTLMRQHYLISEQKKRLSDLEARMFRLENNLRKTLHALGVDSVEERFIISPI